VAITNSQKCLKLLFDRCNKNRHFFSSPSKPFPCDCFISSKFLKICEDLFYVLILFNNIIFLSSSSLRPYFFGPPLIYLVGLHNVNYVPASKSLPNLSFIQLSPFCRIVIPQAKRKILFIFKGKLVVVITNALRNIFCLSL